MDVYIHSKMEKMSGWTFVYTAFVHMRLVYISDLDSIAPLHTCKNIEKFLHIPKNRKVT